MVEDTPMAEEDSSAKPENQDKVETAPSVPPLEASARRLERLLGGGAADKGQQLRAYTNPTKVIRRWLGTSSGSAGDATTEDIKAAAAKLLDPAGACASGRELLVSGGEEGGEKKDSYLSAASAREVEAWLISVAVRHLWKGHKFQEAFDLAQKGIEIIMAHIDQASIHITSLSAGSTSSLFPLLSRMFRLRSLMAEALNDSNLTALLRADMSKAHNMAALRRDVDTQAAILNSMLRDLLRSSQVEQAEKLLANSTFPETASNNQLCRYLYYSARIQALRLDYTASFSGLSQCLRKAPTNTGVGFRIAAQRLLVVVQMLMGDIPERHVFFTKGMKAELLPYLHITQAVRRGDLAVFTEVVSKYATRLQQDGTYTLISRLAHQVVKAGLRNLNVSYSRLSLEDVAHRLGLLSATSAEFVVAKAVRDGVLDATIHHEEGYVQSHELVDVYATKEPALAFHRRIAYCLTTHNDAVRGMRYPPDAYKKQLEASRGNRRKRNDDKTDEEKAQELEEEYDEDY